MSDTMEPHKEHCSEEFILEDPCGLHARPSTIFVQKAMAFQSEVQVQNLDSGTSADGKSVLSMLMLAAPVGTKIRVTADGPDAQEAMKVFRNLFFRGFDED